MDWTLILSEKSVFLFPTWLVVGPGKFEKCRSKSESLVALQVCTFALLVKNAASLLDDGDPLKLEAETRLDNLTRFTEWSFKIKIFLFCYKF